MPLVQQPLGASTAAAPATPVDIYALAGMAGGGHDRTLRARTTDVDAASAAGAELTFADMLLPADILRGLQASGFGQPSPVQQKAIPLGCAGFDVIAQAKSGTGKTCVLAVVALKAVDPSVRRPQAIVLAPTREIAVQLAQVITAIGRFTGVRCETFIGGLPRDDDASRAKQCHVAVGTPGRRSFSGLGFLTCGVYSVGRLFDLVAKEVLAVQALRLLVLDEADQLLTRDFMADINGLYQLLPLRKQMLALSAT
jgi:ATP-dependent RNA helicase DDX20